MTRSPLGMVVVAAALGLSALCGCARTRCSAPCEARESEPAQVFLDGMVLRVPRDRVAEIVGADAPPGAPPRVLSAADATALRDRAAKASGVSVVMMPKILALAGQEATVSIGETLPDAKGARTWVGQEFRTVPTPSPDGSTIALDFSFALSDRPAEGTTPDAAAVQAGTARGAAHVERLPSGDSFLLVAPATPSTPDERILVLMSAVVLDPAAATR